MGQERLDALLLLYIAADFTEKINLNDVLEHWHIHYRQGATRRLGIFKKRKSILTLQLLSPLLF